MVYKINLLMSFDGIVCYLILNNGWCHQFSLEELILHICICVTDIKYIMYNVQDYSVLYYNAVRTVICEGWRAQIR
jgi:hypothetical protein